MPPPLDIAELLVEASSSQAQDPRQRVRRTWLINALLDLLTTSPASPEGLLEKASLLLSTVLTKKPQTLSSTQATVAEVVELFDLELLRAPMSLPDAPHDTPQLLTLNLANLEKAFYDERSEASCRIAVDYMLVAAKVCVYELHPPPTRSAKRLKTLGTPTDSHKPPEPLHIFPELELEVTVADAHANPILVNGRADWALGYKTRSDALDGTVLVAIEAKRRDRFGAAEAQLLTYLAILRQLRLNARKTNAIVQGCYTDGERYVFVCIDNDGLVAISNVYDIRGVEQRKVVFNYLVTVLETAVRTSPTTSPVKRVCVEEDVRAVGRDFYRKVYCVGEGLQILDEENDEDGVLLELPDVAAA
ncbi:hypothetical protein Q9L58_009554 [Maublancomyces gigas]|uniref:Uncharacterized protein n=1 Tax=Discina gigas TaxID=1032678 RepID=A0ABR3G6Y5_9PEZI